MQKHNHSAMMMITVRLTISYKYIFLFNTQTLSKKKCCADNEEGIFEQNTNEDEYMFSGQGMLNTILVILASLYFKFT
jgi:hypothetical protein